MNDSSMTFGELIAKLWGHKWRIVLVTASVTLFGTVYVVSLPRSYTAREKIVIERRSTQAMSGAMSMLGGLAGIGGSATSGITMDLAPAIVKSVNFILEFETAPIELFKPVAGAPRQLSYGQYLADYQRTPWWSSGRKFSNKEAAADTVPLSRYELSKTQETFVRIASKTMTVTTDTKSNVMTLAVTTQDPMASVVLVDSLANKLQQYLTAYQTRKARQELEQSIKIADTTRQRYYQAQENYVHAADRNQNLVLLGAKARQDRLNNDMNVALQSYTSAALQVEVARTKVLENTPVFSVLEPPLLDKSAAAPNRKLVVAVSFLVGLFLGIGSVVIGDIWRSMLATGLGKDDTASH